MRSLNGITDSMDMSLSKFQLRQGEGHHEGQESLESSVHGVTKSWTQLTTEQQQQQIRVLKLF